MQKYKSVKAICLLTLFVIWGSATSVAQEETVIISASGFGGTEEKALEQAAFHAVIKVVEKHFSMKKAYGAHQNEIRQFIQENMSLFTDNLTEAKVIYKYRRNKLTARISVKEADVIEALKDKFPDLN
jgi:hypothetical protein